MTRAHARLERALLGAVVAALIVAAWFPFQPGFEGPYLAENQAQRGADGSLRLREPSIVRTRGAPEWARAALREGALELTIEAAPDAVDQRGPARIVSLSRDTKRQNLMLGQEGSDLVVRCRRPGAGPDGEPSMRVPSVFTQAGRSRTIDVFLDSAVAVVRVDGTERAREVFQEDPFPRWDGTYALAVGDEHTRSRAWNGTLRRAEARVGGRSYDLLDPAELEVPATFWQVPERARRILELDRGAAAKYALWHFAIFVPFGWAALRVSRGRGAVGRRVARIVAAAALFSLVLELGKLGFAGRHPSILHAVFDAAGAGTGAWLCTRRPAAQPETRCAHAT